tara:strand:+ start:671 stop:1144 length:474 start_codon:yes stop_codon:yes gene_type:complete
MIRRGDMNKESRVRRLRLLSLKRINKIAQDRGSSYDAEMVRKKRFHEDGRHEDELGVIYCAIRGRDEHTPPGVFLERIVQALSHIRDNPTNPEEAVWAEALTINSGLLEMYGFYYVDPKRLGLSQESWPTQKEFKSFIECKPELYVDTPTPTDSVQG